MIRSATAWTVFTLATAVITGCLGKAGQVYVAGFVMLACLAIALLLLSTREPERIP